VPDATTLLNFRHLLEQHDLGAGIFAKVGELLLASGLKLCGGTIVDATIIAAPNSSKNQDKARDPEMHSTRKAGHGHFGVDPFSRTPYRSETRSPRCPIPKRHTQRNFASR
jgi:transposase, IS5 family